jgi:hypothetical protein
MRCSQALRPCIFAEHNMLLLSMILSSCDETAPSSSASRSVFLRGGGLKNEIIGSVDKLLLKRSRRLYFLSYNLLLVVLHEFHLFRKGAD